MQTIVFLLILFLIVIFSILLFYKTKHSRVDQLNNGQCPTCKEKTRTFFDQNTNTTFKQEVITSRVLKNHGCSGTVEIEYRCKSCGLKEVYPQYNG